MGELAKVKNSLRKKGYNAVACSEWRKSIRLEGEMDNWEDIVRAGKLAAKFGYKGVINDIKLKGFSAPAIRAPRIRDGSLEGRAPDVLIIGGGVVGCAIARELSRYKLDIALLEKENDVAMQTSSRNDGMIHPGIASHPGTLRGEMNVRGNAMYGDLCRDLSVDFKRYGNLILYSDRLFGLGGALVLGRRQRLMGIEGKKISRAELEKIEPNITDEARGAFEYPSSGVLSPYKLTVALAENAVENGASVYLETIVEAMQMSKGRIEGVVTNRGVLRPKLVINAAGVFCEQVAEMANDRFFSIHPRKGELVILDKKQGGLVQRSMGLVGISQAFSDTKGGGVMRTIDQNVLVGPDAYEQPYLEDFSTNRENINRILDKHLKLIKGFKRSDVITYFAGIRAATYEEEFIIEASENVANLVHAAGIQSPGLASAPAIAEEIAKISVSVLARQMTVHKNNEFNPVRKAGPVLAKLSFDEKQAVIKKNPDYGTVVCRCEAVSRGEIMDAVNSPVPALSVDAVKRRVRPGMGRCQGGFCAPLVAKIISEQSGKPMDEITKSGEGSELLYREAALNE